MRFYGLVTSFVLAISAAGPVLAQAQRGPDPIPITEWSRDKIVAMGQEIHRQDVAAWVATDALMKKFGGTPPQGLVGWIVVPEGRDQKVRFLKTDDNVVTAGWDVVVRNGRAGDVVDVSGGVLSDQEQARFRARMTAASNIGRLRCSANMNAVVADDPHLRPGLLEGQAQRPADEAGPDDRYLPHALAAHRCSSPGVRALGLDAVVGPAEPVDALGPRGRVAGHQRHHLLGAAGAGQKAGPYLLVVQ